VIGITPPAGFEIVREGRLRGLARSDILAPLLPLLRQWDCGTLPASRALVGGRGGIGAYDLAPNLEVVLRPSRRGGWIGRVNQRFYVGVRPRPLLELRVTETLRQRGVPTVEVLAAVAHWVVPGLYRGAVVTREIPLAVNLWKYLREVSAAERERVCLDAAAATRRLHDAGATHPDLNLQNFLVLRGAKGREVLIIDCDRVRLRQPSDRDRRAAFERVCRSIRRLDPTSEVISLACVDAFRRIARPAEAGLGVVG
jgi:tRNA A-37 threonylcarbamoyl transferase component Bud32